jgi:hypothetical protein
MGRDSWSRRYKVEDCRVISITKLKEWGYFSGISGIQLVSSYGGGIRWTNSYGEEVGSIGIHTKININGGEICLQYSREIFPGEYEEYDYPIKLEPTPCFFGGRRWWFICCKNPDGVYCGNRVGRLYLPPNGRYFSCRHCYNLTYASCRQSRAFERMIKRMAIALGKW